MEKIYKIYKYANKINNKIYIGQTKDSLEKRAGKNGSFYKRCPLFYKAILKYGWENFEAIILKDNLTKEEANKYEQYYIQLYNSTNTNNGYNISFGGYNKISEFTKDKISQTLKEYYTTDEGVKAKKHLSVIASKRKGEKNPFYGKHHTLDSKRKMSEKQKQKMGNEAPRSIPILMMDENGIIIKEFVNKKEALNYLGISQYTTLNKAIKEKKLYKGYYWILKADNIS